MPQGMVVDLRGSTRSATLPHFRPRHLDGSASPAIRRTERGQLRCKDDVLYGVDLAGNRYPCARIPRFILPLATAQADLIRDKRSMAVAWLGSAASIRCSGYVVSTWYGRGDRGHRRDISSAEPRPLRRQAAHTYAFRQSITWQLQTRYEKSAKIDCSQWEHRERSVRPGAAGGAARLYPRRARLEGRSRPTWDHDSGLPTAIQPRTPETTRSQPKFSLVIRRWRPLYVYLACR